MVGSERAVGGERLVMEKRMPLLHSHCLFEQGTAKTSWVQVTRRKIGMLC